MQSVTTRSTPSWVETPEERQPQPGGPQGKRSGPKQDESLAGPAPAKLEPARLTPAGLIPASFSLPDEIVQQKKQPEEALSANDGAAAENPRHYQRGHAPTEAGSLLYADGLLALASFAMALVGFAFFATILAANLVFGRPAPSSGGLFSLAALALCACGGIAAGILLILHSNRFQLRRKLSLAAVACWLIPGALLLAAGLPSYPALSRILPLACLTLSLACLIKVFLEAWVHRRSEIFSMVDPGFYDQLATLTREGNLLFAAAAAVLCWAALILWRLAS